MPIYLNVATFVTHWQSWAAVTEVIRLAKSKMFILHLFTLKVCRSLFSENENFRNWWEFILKANYMVESPFLCSRHWQVRLRDCDFIWCQVLAAARSEQSLGLQQPLSGKREPCPAPALESITESHYWNSHTDFPLPVLYGVQHRDFG